MTTRGRPPLSPAQLTLLREIVSSRSPDLLGIVGELESGETIAHDEAARLRFLLLQTLVLEELGEDGEPTRRGKDIDELAGSVSRQAADYYD
jgi:hypothetical protein